MEKVEHDLFTSKHTEVYHENPEDMRYSAPHHFTVQKVSVPNQPYVPGKEGLLSKVDFQEGPIKECGVNGVLNDDLIAMVICRLEHFQKSEFSCRENALTITKLEEALLWLRKRTMGREKRGVVGTYVK